MPIPYKKVFLIVLDGFGIAAPDEGNAILKARMPYIDSLVATYPTFSLAASGLVVGLPWGQPGNSEVGHSAMGTGRIIIQDLAHINADIRSGEFYKNPAFLEAINHAKKNSSALHVIGCTSPGGIHSHVDHLIALLELAHRNGLTKIFVHFIADGQDMPPKDAVNVLMDLEVPLKKSGAKIASIQGRSFAMDRVLNWKLTEKVWHAIVLGDAPAISDPKEYLETSYADGMSDYSVEPATVTIGGEPVGRVGDHDAVIFFDFRNDRVMQLATPFIMGEDFKSFDTVRTPKDVMVVTMTKYKEEFTVPIAYEPAKISNTLGEIISNNGWSQWRIAEKEKEAHVTNFFNGGRIEVFAGERRDIVSSRLMRGKEYIQHPEMSIQKIVDSVLEKITDGARFSLINIANPDMIGHTGDLEATIKALEVTDNCLKKLVGELSTYDDYVTIITADHGNAEELTDPLTGGHDTQHSTRNVPVILINTNLAQATGKTLAGLDEEPPVGTLEDIAATVLHFLGIAKPDEMTGSSIV